MPATQIDIAEIQAKCKNAYARLAWTGVMHRHGHKFSPERMAYLESEERKLLLDPERTLRHFDIQKGWIAIDVGCGPGVFTIPLARAVGAQGSVSGIDTEPLMISRLEERIEEEGVENVETLLSKEDSIPLPDSSADFALLSTVLHELDGLGTLLEIGRILKKPGMLGIIDWKKKSEPMGPPKEHRLSEDEAVSLLREAKFESGPPINISASHYGFKARRR